MTTAIALTSSFLPGRLLDNGMEIPPDLTFEEWEEALRRAEWLEAASPWFVVDLVAFGRAKFGEDYSQALPDAIEDADGFHQAKLKQAEWMADRWPASTRVPGQSYSAHRAVAKLNRDDAVALLHEEDADGRRLTVRALTKRAEEIEQSLRGKAVDATGAVVDSVDLAWCPDISELTDEAREALERQAPRGRLRSTYISGAIWMAVWLGAEGAFKEWKGP